MKNEIEIGDFVSAKFAALNKSETLEEYKKECSKDEIVKVKRLWDGVEVADEYISWNIENCKVEQYFKLSLEEWNDITNNLLEDRLIFRGKGGTIYTGTNPNFDIDKLGSDEEMLKDYRLNHANVITILENDDTGELVAIDPQGYNYARYAGIEVKKGLK